MIVADARRRRTRSEKEAIVAELSAPGATVSAIARKHNISSSLLFRWHRELGGEARQRASSGGRFLPVMLAAPSGGRGVKSAPADGMGSGVIEIELCCGKRVRVDASVDVAALRRVLDILALR